MPQSIEWILAAPFGLLGVLVWVAVAAAPVVFVIGLVKALRARKKERKRGEEDAARQY